MFEEAIRKYYEMLSKRLIAALEGRGWTVYFAGGKGEARKIILEILAKSEYKEVGILGSITVRRIGLIEELSRRDFFNFSSI